MHRIERANRLLRNSRIIILVGFGLLAIATLALIVGLFRSREADMAARKRELVNAIRVLISEPPVWGSRRSRRTLRDALEHRGRDAREHGLGLRGLQYFGNRV